VLFSTKISCTVEIYASAKSRFVGESHWCVCASLVPAGWIRISPHWWFHGTGLLVAGALLLLLSLISGSRETMPAHLRVRYVHTGLTRRSCIRCRAIKPGDTKYVANKWGQIIKKRTEKHMLQSWSRVMYNCSAFFFLTSCSSLCALMIVERKRYACG
jgi:hypothetical protein